MMYFNWKCEILWSSTLPHFYWAERWESIKAVINFNRIEALIDVPFKWSRLGSIPRIRISGCAYSYFKVGQISSIPLLPYCINSNAIVVILPFISNYWSLVLATLVPWHNKANGRLTKKIDNDSSTAKYRAILHAVMAT